MLVRLMQEMEVQVWGSYLCLGIWNAPKTGYVPEQINLKLAQSNSSVGHLF